LCNGKTVKITTRIKYEKKEQWLQDSIYRLMKSKGKDKKKDDPVPVRFPILVSDEIQFNSDDSSQNLHDKAVMIDNDHDQFHKTNNIILSEKYEKQVDSTGNEKTGDEEYSFDDEEGFQSIDELDDDKIDLEDYDLPLNDDELFAASSLANPNYNSDQENNININNPWILL